jgi:hypothetical protein
MPKSITGSAIPSVDEYRDADWPKALRTAIANGTEMSSEKPVAFMTLKDHFPGGGEHGIDDIAAGLRPTRWCSLRWPMTGSIAARRLNSRLICG